MVARSSRRTRVSFSIFLPARELNRPARLIRHNGREYTKIQGEERTFPWKYEGRFGAGCARPFGN